MTVQTCSCSGPPRRPLCATCRALADLVPLIRPALTRRGRLPGDDVDDLLQQVLLELALTGRPPDALRGLAVAIARERHIDRLRGLRRRTRCKPWRTHLAEAAARPTTVEMERDLEEAMSLMASDTRAVLEAVALARLTRRQAAQALGLSLHAVRMLYAEAQRFLRRRWDGGK